MHGATDRQLPLECYDLVAVLGYPITLYGSLHYYKDRGAWSRRGGGGDDRNHVVKSWTNNLTYHCSGKATFQGIKHLHEARRNQFLHTSIGVRKADKIMKISCSPRDSSLN